MVTFPSGLSVLSAVKVKEFHLVELKKTWKEARNFCNRQFSDLVTIKNHIETEKVKTLTPDSGSIAWIGLYDNLKKWKWSHGSRNFDSHNNFNRLKYTALRTSHFLGATISLNGDWIPKNSSAKLPSVCYNGKI